MKPLLIIMLSLCIACNAPTKQVVIPKKEAKNLRFSMRNDTKISIKKIKVRLPDTTLYFSNLDSMSRTNWINVKSAYHYGPMEFKDSKDSTYILRIRDYEGEKLYDSGCMTFIFQLRDIKGKQAGKDNSIYESTRWGYSLDCSNEIKQ